MRVSIIIPSLNSPIIDQVIGRIVGQECIEQLSEIIVVGKDAPGLIPAHKLVRFVDTGEPVPAGTARNIGIEQAIGEWLIFLDSDCLPHKHWLKNHLQASKKGYQVVGGGVRPSGDNYWQLVYNLTLFHENFATSHAAERDYFPTLNLAVSQAVIGRVGKLDEGLTRGQDIEWTTRMKKAGYTLSFAPDAEITHAHNRTTLGAVWRDCARSGYHMRQVRMAHRDQLQAPFILRYRWLILLLSPLIATVRTVGIVGRHAALFASQPLTIVGIWITKVAWCWGASRKNGA